MKGQNQAGGADFSAAQFAALCGTTKRTLRYYEQLGIFRPAAVLENGYRRYSHEQYDAFMVISALQQIGMSLEEIGRFMAGRTPGSLAAVLRRQLGQLEQQQARLARLNTLLENRLELVEQAAGAVCGRVEARDVPAETLVLSRPVDSSARVVYRRALYAHLEQCKDLAEGFPFGAMLDARRVRAGDSATYAYFFTKVTAPPPAGVPVHEKPAGRYACVYLRGDYRNAADACAALVGYAAARGLGLGPYFYKEGIVDEIASASAAGYLTQISVLLERS